MSGAQPRKNAGQFTPGTTGNPSGRPRQTVGLTQMARLYTEEMLGIAVKCARASDSSWAEKLRAVDLVLDRGHGKAKGELADLVGDAATQHLLAVQAVAKNLVVDERGATVGVEFDPGDAGGDLAPEELAALLGIDHRPTLPEPLAVGLPLFEAVRPRVVQIGAIRFAGRASLLAVRP